jgi:hypothetical protein
MDMETFLARLHRGRANSYTYCSPDVLGQIDVYQTNQQYVVQWEECDPEDYFDDARIWKMETHQFETVDQMLDFLDGNALPIGEFRP